jgi:hypothetical protein
MGKHFQEPTLNILTKPSHETFSLRHENHWRLYRHHDSSCAAATASAAIRCRFVAGGPSLPLPEMVWIRLGMDALFALPLCVGPPYGPHRCICRLCQALPRISPFAAPTLAPRTLSVAQAQDASRTVPGIPMTMRRPSPAATLRGGFYTEVRFRGNPRGSCAIAPVKPRCAFAPRKRSTLSFGLRRHPAEGCLWLRCRRTPLPRSEPRGTTPVVTDLIIAGRRLTAIARTASRRARRWHLARPACSSRAEPGFCSPGRLP